MSLVHVVYAMDASAFGLNPISCPSTISATQTNWNQIAAITKEAAEWQFTIAAGCVYVPEKSLPLSTRSGGQKATLSEELPQI